MKIAMIKCDRCGLLYDENNKGLNLTTYKKAIEDFRNYDLCTKCSELFLSFIDGQVLSEKQIVEEPVKSCEEKCYDKIVAVKDFKRCSGCFKKSQCPAAHDNRCNKEDQCDDDIVDLCEEVYENLPTDKAEPKPFDQNGKYYTWNEKEIDFLYNNYKNMSVAEMAESLGRSSNSVYAKMTKLGLKSNVKRKPHGRRPFEKWEIDYIQDNHDLMTIDELADAFGRSSTSVRSKLKELGLEAKRGE